ncbi:hypothetical protein HPP92_015252 [Vanilla planifolia]|uniref:Uncharacterized protein n=1 Tax=Vanilla planifolia TaxID=51239 RepID=A0A835UTZ9_VANPL|nr:hypothetical protein HPP92_015774 [Vanilla planifolia]KAG0475566.1 hypothetical protein HPP92_015252 [Vanilla planifolia]
MAAPRAGPKAMESLEGPGAGASAAAAAMVTAAAATRTAVANVFVSIADKACCAFEMVA